jgi:hypothetical protein
MLEVLIICQYCGHKTTKVIYNQKSLTDETCDKCDDKNLVVKELSKSKIDFYEGCPPFPEKGVKDSESCNPDAGWPWSMGGD